MVISGKSDARVLVDQQDNGGLKNFFLSVMLFSVQLSHYYGVHSQFGITALLANCWRVSDRCSLNRSLSFSNECLGQHLGSHQGANLGDGNGIQNETAGTTSIPNRSTYLYQAVIRYNYGDPYLGTCKETVQGGNHFRYWIQNGKDANSGAFFMACSYEFPVDRKHFLEIPQSFP